MPYMPSLSQLQQTDAFLRRHLGPDQGEQQAMLDALNRGDILAFATQYPVGEGAIAIDQAVRLIEKKPVMSLVQPVATVIDKTTVPKLQMDLVLAPASWTPVYSVKAK